MASEDGDLLLPPEIWRDILIRLPVKSILRCRPVCKSWYSLISCPNFISIYSTRNPDKSGNRVLLNLYDNRANVYSFSSHDESFVESREHDDFAEPFLGRNNLRIVGSCNGLICLYKFDPGLSKKDSVYTFLIWNPAIRKVFEVPSRSFCSRTQYASYLGFGFDSKTCDYKILFIVGNVVDMGEKPGDSPAVVASVCEIFDLSKGVWRRISPVVRAWNVGRRAPDCYLDGVVHWAGYRYANRNSDMIVLSFSMSDEVFGEIMMPNCAEFTENGGDDDGESYTQSKSVTCGGLIHVIVWKNGPDDFIDMSESCSVWAMKEYGITDSWTKVSNIHLPSAQGLPTTQLWPHKFRLWENGEVFMVNGLEVGDDEDFGHNQELVLYNTDSRKSKRLFSITKCISNVCFYKEGLVLM